MLPYTHLCEQGFSEMFCMKANLRDRLYMKDGLRVSLPKPVPRIEAQVFTSPHIKVVYDLTSIQGRLYAANILLITSIKRLSLN